MYKITRHHSVQTPFIYTYIYIYIYIYTSCLLFRTITIAVSLQPALSTGSSGEWYLALSKVHQSRITENARGNICETEEQ
jgi:hypothetical protein